MSRERAWSENYAYQTLNIVPYGNQSLKVEIVDRNTASVSDLNNMSLKGWYSGIWMVEVLKVYVLYERKLTSR